MSRQPLCGQRCRFRLCDLFGAEAAASSGQPAAVGVGARGRLGAVVTPCDGRDTFGHRGRGRCDRRGRRGRRGAMGAGPSSRTGGTSSTSSSSPSPSSPSAPSPCPSTCSGPPPPPPLLPTLESDARPPQRRGARATSRISRVLPSPALPHRAGSRRRWSAPRAKAGERRHGAGGPGRAGRLGRRVRERGAGGVGVVVVVRVAESRRRAWAAWSGAAADRAEPVALGDPCFYCWSLLLELALQVLAVIFTPPPMLGLALANEDGGGGLTCWLGSAANRVEWRRRPHRAQMADAPGLSTREAELHARARARRRGKRSTRQGQHA